MDKKILFSFVCTSILICIVTSLPPGSPRAFPCRELPTTGNETKLDCVVETGQYLDYRQIRDLTSARPSNEKFNIFVTCSGGKVYLPWPFRARNVIGLKVQGCRVEGFLAERNTALSNPDELKTIYLIDSSLEVTVSQLYDTLVNLNKMTKDFECGPTNVRENVFRNVRYDFPMHYNDMTTILLMEKLMSGESLQALVNRNTLCVYPHLRHLEESGTNSLSSVHFKLVEGSKYPQLRTYSVRNNSLGRIPSELRSLPVAFLPSLEKLELSHNNIDNLNFVLTGVSAPVRTIYIDMRYNNVRHITAAFVLQLADSSAAVIDLRNNPIECSCPLYLYWVYVEQLSQTDPSLNPLRDIECFMTSSGSSVVERRMINADLGSSLCAGR